MLLGRVQAKRAGVHHSFREKDPPRQDGGQAPGISSGGRSGAAVLSYYPPYSPPHLILRLFDHLPSFLASIEVSQPYQTYLPP